MLVYRKCKCKSRDGCQNEIRYYLHCGILLDRPERKMRQNTIMISNKAKVM